MRLDMHCHTKEGSLDGKLPLKDYVLRLKELGYDGMLLTDHNSYKAYRYYLRNSKDEEFRDFTILKGIEYDTCDAGHILVVMPENFHLPILELRGLPVRLLIEIVHTFHGILGPAHPTGEKYLGITNCKHYRKHPNVLKEFDFIETYNSCVSPEANRDAAALALAYQLPGTGGSDAHKLDCVGLAWTELGETVRTESELIAYIKGQPVISCGGEHYPGTTRDHFGILYDILLRVFAVYSKMGNFHRRKKREEEIEALLTASSNFIQRIQELSLMEITEVIPHLIRNRRRRRRIRRKLHLQYGSKKSSRKKSGKPRRKFRQSIPTDDLSQKQDAS